MPPSASKHFITAYLQWMLKASTVNSKKNLQRPALAQKPVLHTKRAAHLFPPKCSRQNTTKYAAGHAWKAYNIIATIQKTKSCTIALLKTTGSANAGTVSSGSGKTNMRMMEPLTTPGLQASSPMVLSQLLSALMGEMPFTQCLLKHLLTRTLVSHCMKMFKRESMGGQEWLIAKNINADNIL